MSFGRPRGRGRELAAALACALVCVATLAGVADRTASDGAEALSVAECHEAPIHVLVTDIVMPKMRGPELASRLRVARPDVKVLFMSGYSGSADTADALTTEDSAFLAKPFTPTQLVARVRALLDGVQA